MQEQERPSHSTRQTARSCHSQGLPYCLSASCCVATESNHQADLQHGLPEHQVIQGASHSLRENGNHNPVGPHDHVGQGFPEEGIQPEAHSLGCVGAAQGLTKVQLELDLWWLPTHRGKICVGQRLLSAGI